MHKQIGHCFSLLITVIVFSSCGDKKPAEKAKGRGSAAVIVDVLVAKPEPVSNIIEANGTVLPNEFTELHPEVSGRITYLNLPEGNAVQEGLVLAKINSADLAAQLAKSKVQLELAEKTSDRYQQLLAVNGINESDYDAAVNQVNSLKADMAYTQTLIDKTVIKAPFSGVLGLRQVSPGAYVTPATVLATLQQTSQVKIDFTLPEIYGTVLKKGSLVKVQTDALSGQYSQARVIAIEPGANTDTRNITVRAILDGRANPGGFVKVFVDEGKTRSSVHVPASSIIPDDKNNQLVIVKNGKARFVDVKTGIREADMVEILQGVATGDSVVVTGVLFVRPNSSVTVRSIKTAAQLTADEGADSTTKQ